MPATTAVTNFGPKFDYTFAPYSVTVLKIAMPPAAVTLASSLNPSGNGQSVTFTATVTGNSPTGLVTFADGSTVLGTAPVIGGRAAFTTAALSIGTHNIGASYGGDSLNLGSQSAALSQTVIKIRKKFPAHLLWTNTSGQASVWTVNTDGTFDHLEFGPFAGWTARAVSDGPDGSSHLLWTNTNGQAAVWNVSASGQTVSHQFGPFPGYTAAGLSTGGDGVSHLLWNRADGLASLWAVNTTSGAFTHAEYGPFGGWAAQAVASGKATTDLLWTQTGGQMSAWVFAGGGLSHTEYGPYPGWQANALSVGPDETAYPLWNNPNGQAALWTADFPKSAFTDTEYGPIANMTAKAVATGPDNVTHLLWDNADGTAAVWSLSSNPYNPGYTSYSFGPFAGWTAVALSAGP